MRPKPVEFICDYCGGVGWRKPSHMGRTKRHFCSRACYSSYRSELLPKEEQHAYKNGGIPEDEKALRRKARSDANHALRDGKIIKQNCRVCGSDKAQMHHKDYSKPLEIDWLCLKCHRKEHDNPELMEGE